MKKFTAARSMIHFMSSKRSILRRPMSMLMLFGLALALGGCSTPTPPDYAEGELYSEAMNSYSLCQSRMYPVDGGRSCDSQTLGRQQSYGEYSRNNNQDWQTNYNSKVGSEGSLKLYFDTLSAEDVELLDQEWRRLAEQY